MPELERDNVLELAYGVRIRSVGVGATVGDVRRAPIADTPVRGVEPGAFTAAMAELGTESGGVAGEASARLGPVAEAAGMREVLAVSLDDLTVPPGSPAALRSADDQPSVEMSVPAPGPDEGQVVLEIDLAGLLRWHVDVEARATATGAPPRGVAAGPVRGDREQTFRIPVDQVTLANTGQRGLLGLGIRKVLHLVRFPIEAGARVAGKVAVGWWEDRHRPHALDLVTPATVGAPLSTPGVPAARLAQLADEPFLVLVHGTFSTVRGGFAGLTGPAAGAPDLAELVRRYSGRVLAFDHQTLHVDPTVNAEWFLKRLPTDRPLTLDLLTHSRGGLVGRRIADPRLAETVGVPAPQIRTLVHVGTPNAGTVLASPERWTTLIDVLSNLFTLLPDEPATATAEAVLELVKQVATGVFTGLAGLTAMDPTNPAVVAANRQGPGGATGSAGVVRAVASDFSPAGNAALRMRALNALVDPFFGAGNDLVVPTDGVFNAGAYRVTDPYVVSSTSSVAHTAFFHTPEVRRKLAEWLPGSF